MMELQAQHRTVLGKGTKKLRRAGIVPANVSGPGVASQAVEVAAADIKQLLHDGVPRSMTLQIARGNPAKSFHVRIADLQRDPVHGDVIHIDFLAIGG